MNPHEQEELAGLLESLIEGDLDESGRVRLRAMLEGNPGLLDEVRRQLLMDHELAGWARPDPAYVERTVAHVTQLAAEGEDVFVRGFQRRVWVRRWRGRLAAAAVIAFGAALWWMIPRGTGEPAATLSLTNTEGMIVSSRRIPAGGTVAEDHGLMRLDFPNGAVLAVEGPARLTVVSSWEVRLDRGRLNAWCPESAHGFTVRTAHAAATDLGTSFGVSAGDGGQADFVVLDGSVEVANQRETIRLEEGSALSSDDSGALRSVDFNPSGFKRTWPLALGILSTKGELAPAEPDTPERLAALEHDACVLVIPERRGIPFDRPIRADFIAPGTMPGDFDGMGYDLPPVGGKRLNAYQLRYNPVGSFPEEKFLRFEGEVTFDRPVVAIQCQNEYLVGGDEMFATGPWSGELRGIELTQIRNPPDSVTLSADRRTVRVVFYTGRYTDAVRVIVEAN